MYVSDILPKNRLLIVRTWTFTDAFYNIHEHWLDNGFTMIDFAATFLLVWMHIITTVIFLILLQKAAKPISKLCTVMARLNKNLGIDEKALHKLNRRTYFALLFLFVLHVMSVITSIEFCQNLLVEKIVFIPLSTIWLVTISIFYWPFPAAASFLVNRLCLFNLILQMDTFEYKAQKSRNHFFTFYNLVSSCAINFMEKLSFRKK